jgi:DNA recombination protein RmuC
MPLWIVGVVAFAGVLAGYLWQSASAKREKSQLELRAADLTRDLGEARSGLAQTQAESAARAGFEAVAAERTKTIDALRSELESKASSERNLAARVKELEADLRNERQNLAEKLELLESAKKSLSDQFQVLAADILEKKSQTFSENNQKELGTLLNPLRDQIKDFRTKVEEAQKESLVGRTQLSKELEQLKGLNQLLSDEAHALTNALTRDTGEQGHWGELVLLDLLEACDLKRGLHYTYQQTFTPDGADGLREERRRTDVVLRFPEGRSLVIDSKVTLTSHKEYVEATDDATRKDALDRLAASIRNHMRELAAKNYQELLGEKSPDYVVLFAANEAAYLLAVQADPKLITDGYKSRVLVAGPTTILHIARIVESLWRNEERAKSLEQIGERARLLFDGFTLFVDALENVRTSILKAAAQIHNAEESNNEAIRRLTTGRGNLVSQAEKLGRLANKSSKQIASRVLELADDQPELAIAASADEPDKSDL